MALILKKVNKRKFILTAICLIALAGFLLPAVIINIDFMGFSEGISVVNIISFLTKSDTQSDRTGLSQFGSGNGGGILAGAGMKLLLFAGLYFLTLIFLIITLICVLTGKSKKQGFILAAITLILHICTGWSIINFRETVFSAIEKNYEFIASLINITEKVKVNFGVGYWITGTAIVFVILTAVVFYKE